MRRLRERQRPDDGEQVNALIAAGQLWRLVTPALLHGDVLHLLVNCYSLNQVGPASERLLGPQRFLSLYVTAAVTGNLASFLFCPNPGVGSSGAILGLVGSMAMYFARHRGLHGRAGELQLECVPRDACRRGRLQSTKGASQVSHSRHAAQPAHGRHVEEHRQLGAPRRPGWGCALHAGLRPHACFPQRQISGPAGSAYFHSQLM